MYKVSEGVLVKSGYCSSILGIRFEVYLVPVETFSGSVFRNIQSQDAS